MELLPRVGYYLSNAAQGIEASNTIGRGTGDQSVGTQYLGENRPEQKSESGWGAVATEWGLLGLAVWCSWVFLWVRRGFAIARSSLPSSAVTPIAPLLALWVFLMLVVYFSFGPGFFDNYVTNIFFWLLSGVLFSAGTRGGTLDAGGNAGVGSP